MKHSTHLHDNSRFSKARMWQILLVTLAMSYPTAKLAEGLLPNLSYISLLAMVLLAGISAIKRPTLPLLILILLLPFIYYIFSGLSVDSLPHSSEKIAGFTQTLLIFGVLMGLCLNSSMSKDYIVWALLINGAVATLMLLTNTSSHQVRAAIGESNPIWVARAISYLGLSGILLLKTPKKSITLVGVVAILISMFGIYLTGSRGPLLGVTICVIAYVILFDTKRSLIYRLFLFSVGGFILTYIGIQYIPADSRIFSNSNLYENSRVELLKYAFHLIYRYPEGIGVGGFYVTSSLTYPHNLFVEFIVEWGWFDGGLFIFIILLGSVRLLIAKGQWLIIYKLLLLNELTNSMFSGNILSPRILYGLVIFGLFYNFDKFKLYRRKKVMSPLFSGDNK